MEADACWAKGVENWEKNIPERYKGKKELEYKAACTTGNRTYFQLTDGNILLRDIIYQGSDPDGEEKYTIYLNELNDWYEVKLNEYTSDNLAKEMTEVIAGIAIEIAKVPARYALPIEDGYVVITGKDLDGESSSKILAGTFIVVDIAGGKIFKVAGKGIKALLKSGQKIIVTIGKRSVKLFYYAKEYSPAIEKLVEVVGKTSDDIIVIATKTGKWSDALALAKNLAGQAPATAKEILNKAGQVVGYKWKGNGNDVLSLSLDEGGELGSRISYSNGSESGEILYKPDAGDDAAKLSSLFKSNKKVINRLIKSIDEFKAAIARGENVFYIGKHTDITPRPKGVQSHHGVNSVWVKAKYSNYSVNKAPTVYMLNNPNHNATRGVFNTWAKEMRIKQGLNKVDYSLVTKDDILDLAKKQFDAAEVPQQVRNEYYKLWNDYLKNLTPK